jgi:hypothetical protein
MLLIGYISSINKKSGGQKMKNRLITLVVILITMGIIVGCSVSVEYDSATVGSTNNKDEQQNEQPSLGNGKDTITEETRLTPSPEWYGNLDNHFVIINGYRVTVLQTTWDEIREIGVATRIRTADPTDDENLLIPPCDGGRRSLVAIVGTSNSLPNAAVSIDISWKNKTETEIPLRDATLEFLGVAFVPGWDITSMLTGERALDVPSFELYGGILLGVSTLDELLEAWGEPFRIGDYGFTGRKNVVYHSTGQAETDRMIVASIDKNEIVVGVQIWPEWTIIG